MSFAAAGKYAIDNTKQLWMSVTSFVWWRHQMETISALLAIYAGNSPVPSEFTAKRPVTWSFDVFFDLRLNKRLSKQSWARWFETLMRPLWRHRNGFGFDRLELVWFESDVLHLLQCRRTSPGISNHRQLVVYSTACSGQQQIAKCPHHWPLARGIHRWLVDFPHKGPVILKVCRCHHVWR